MQHLKLCERPEMSPGRAGCSDQSVSVDSLNQAEQLVLLSLRCFIEERCVGPRLAMIYWLACGPGYVERALSQFEEMLGIIPDGLRRDIKIACPTDSHLTHDEWVLLNLMAVTQKQDRKLAEISYRRLFVAGMANQVRQSIGRFMSTLASCGLKFTTGCL